MESIVYEKFYEIEESNWWFAGMRVILLDLINRHVRLRPGAELLDIGCGTGIWLKTLAAFGRAHGLDLSEEALQFCRERGLTDLRLGSAEDLPYEDDRFDLITAMGVIEHVPDDGRMLREAFRVLKPGGHVLILSSAFNFLWSAHDDIVHHVRRYKRSDLVRLAARSGFEPVRSSYVNALLFPGIAAARLMQRLVGWSPKGQDVTRSFTVSPRLNKSLLALLRLESLLLRRMTFAAGVGVVVLARKPGGSK